MSATEKEQQVKQRGLNRESPDIGADSDWQMMPTISSLLRMTFEKWYSDNIPRHAAALAFYTLFAIAPLLLLAVEIMSLIYGRETAEAQLTAQVEQYVHNAEAAALTQTILNNALPSSANWLVTAGIIIALIYGASAVFGELQIMLNIIWGVHPEDGGDFWQVVWERILAILMVILSGLLIVGGLVLTLWYAEAATWASSRLATDGNLDQITYFVLLLAVTALVFALIYKYVPAVHTAWHDVLIGAVSTAFLVSIARLVITLYMSYNRISSVYGAAGSLVILLLWVYYSAQIFFLGAEFTHVYSRTYGARRRGQFSSGNTTAPRPQRRRNPLRRINGSQITTTPTTSEPLVVKAGERVAPDVEIEIVNLKGQQESRRATTTASATGAKTDREAADGTATEPTDKPKRTWLRWPWRRSNKTPRKTTVNIPASEPDITLPKAEPPTIPMRTEPTVRNGLRQWIKRIVLFPLQVLRPFREIITAIGVIGALSIAVLFGFPWRKWKSAERNSTPVDNREQIDSTAAADSSEQAGGEES